MAKSNAMAATADGKPNSNSQKQLEAAAKRYEAFGKAAGKGSLSLAEAFHQAVKDADNGILTLDKNGKFDADGASFAAKHYTASAAASGMTVTDKTVKKNASYFRQGMSAATLPGIDFDKVVQRVYSTFTTMKAAGQPVRSLIEAYVAAAREQQKDKQKTKELTDEQLAECCAPFVKKPKDKTRYEEWVRIQKAVEKLYEEVDDGADDIDEDDDDAINLVEEVLESIRQRIAALPADEKPVPKADKPKPEAKADKPAAPAKPKAEPAKGNKPAAKKAEPAKATPAGVPSPLGPPSLPKVPTQADVDAALDTPPTVMASRRKDSVKKSKRIDAKTSKTLSMTQRLQALGIH